MGKMYLKKIKEFIRKFDFFGESFTFRYKDEDKHSSVLGGIIYIILYIIAFVYFLYNFIPFINHKIFTLQYYNVNLDETEYLNIKEDPFMFALGITIDNILDYDLSNEYFYIDVAFRSNSGEIKHIETHRCTEEDFSEEVREQFNSLNMQNLYCISKKILSDNAPNGIFPDKGSYYNITVTSEYYFNNDVMKELLLYHDCKLQFYYTDVTWDLLNKSHPNRTLVNSLFLQFNPTLYQKMNVFFMNYHLYDDGSFIHIGLDEEKSKDMIGFSRVEDYAFYMGDDDYTWIYELARLFIRVDNRKVVIKRKYQDFMEFYADTSALLLSLFWILGVLFAYYDKTVINHSISKKLFYFEGIKGNKFDQFKIFKELIYSKEQLENNVQNQQNERIIPFASNINTESRVLRNNSIRRETQFELTISNKDKNKERELIDYSSYNIIDMLFGLKIYCCKTNKFKKKMILIKNAKSIIDDKLDVVFYIRNMILFELINKIYLENKSILNFLSRSIIYLKDPKEIKINPLNDIDTNLSFEIYDEREEKKVDEKKEIEIQHYFKGDLYKTAYKLDSNILSEKIVNLILHPGNTNIQKKLICLLKNHLKGV